MCNGCSGSQGRAGCSACISEKIQNIYFAVGIFYETAHPVPVYGLLRKEACVLKTERFQVENQIPIGDLPGFGQIKKVPAAPAFGAAVIMSVRMFPAAGGLFCLPDDTSVFPGHGPETTIGHEKRNNPYF